MGKLFNIYLKVTSVGMLESILKKAEEKIITASALGNERAFARANAKYDKVFAEVCARRQKSFV